MRIVLFGQAAFAEKVFDGLLVRGHEVAAVYCPPAGAGARPDPVKVRAEARGTAVHEHASLKQAGVAHEVAAYGADLGVLAYVTQIVPPAVFSAPRLGSICFHPSLLPRYRGGSAIPWQIIRGESHTGVSVFWVDPGIDTGPILLQKKAAIGPDDTAATLYYNVLFDLGVAAMLESVDLVAAGKAPRVMQDEAQASYDPLCRDEHAQIDWDQPSDRTYDLIRGCDPQPGAFTSFAGARLRLYDARRVDPCRGLPGEVMAITPEGVTVAAPGCAIRVGRLKAGNAKVAAAQAAEQVGLRVGSRLGGA